MGAGRGRVDALKPSGATNDRAISAFVQFDSLWQYPKPLQPHPPIVLSTLDTPFGRANRQVRRRLVAHVRCRQNTCQHRRRTRAWCGSAAIPMRWRFSLFFLEDKLQSADALNRARDTGAARSIMRLPVADETTVLRTLDHALGCNAPLMWMMAEGRCAGHALPSLVARPRALLARDGPAHRPSATHHQGHVAVR
jgi:hypothetical protein